MGPIPFRNLEEVASWGNKPSPTAVGSKLAADEVASQNGPRPAGSFDIENFVLRVSERFGLEIRGPHAINDGREWRFVGGCPFQPDYAGANAAVFQKSTGELGFNCFCGDHPKKQWRDLRELVDGPKENHSGSQEPA
jgi:hypothetical protein